MATKGEESDDMEVDSPASEVAGHVAGSAGRQINLSSSDLSQQEGVRLRRQPPSRPQPPKPAPRKSARPRAEGNSSGTRQDDCMETDATSGPRKCDTKTGGEISDGSRKDDPMDTGDGTERARMASAKTGQATRGVGDDDMQTGEDGGCGTRDTDALIRDEVTGVTGKGDAKPGEGVRSGPRKSDATPEDATTGSGQGDCVQTDARATRRILIIGRSGTGKSTVGNMLLGADAFVVGSTGSQTAPQTHTAPESNPPFERQRVDHAQASTTVVSQPQLSLPVEVQGQSASGQPWGTDASQEERGHLQPSRTDGAQPHGATDGTQPRSETVPFKSRAWRVSGNSLTVVDTPDITSLDKEAKLKEVTWWKQLTSPAPDVILLTVKQGSGDYAEDLAFYTELTGLWGPDPDLCRRLVVAVTFCDPEVRDAKRMVKKPGPNLQKIVEGAGGRYVILNVRAEPGKRLYEISKILKFIDRDSAEDETGGPMKQRIMIIGKTGNGKSSLANTILGSKAFPVGRGMFTTTTEAKAVSAEVLNKQMTVVDTPDFSNFMPRPSDRDARQLVQEWKSMTYSAPDAILLAVRCDVRYTKEEYDIYREIKKLWEQNVQFCRNLAVVFTFGDYQDDPLEEELKTVCQELKNVLGDAKSRYLQINNRARGDEKDNQFKKLHVWLDGIQGGQKTVPREDGQGMTKSLTDSMVGISEEEQRLLIIGKTGSGKSSLANTITESTAFTVGSGMSSCTQTAQAYLAKVVGKKVKVVDTPDVCTMDISEEERKEEVSRWKEMTSPGPSAILLVVRRDVRFTQHEQVVYEETKRLWGDDNEFCRRLIVVFTFGDHLGNPVAKELELCKELKSVVAQIRGGETHVEISNTASLGDKRDALKKLVFFVETLGEVDASQNASSSSVTPSSDSALQSDPGDVTASQAPSECDKDATDTADPSEQEQESGGCGIA